MLAKYPGTCALCHNSIKAGDQIKWVKGKGAFHNMCPGRCESREGCIPYHYGQYETCIGCSEYMVRTSNPNEDIGGFDS
jgi:hypothetical protein